MIASARHFIEGNRADCLKAIEEAVAGALDMELVFYAARMLARLDEPRWALQGLARASEAGYCGYLQATRDPWLDSPQGGPGIRDARRPPS